MISYVCGFLMSNNLKYFSLIQKGFRGWNGIGGKIEAGEMPSVAMAREFKEETGVYTTFGRWKCFHISQFKNGNKVYFMLAFGDDYRDVRTVTKEPVKIFDHMDLLWLNTEDEPIQYDISFLLAMILAHFKNRTLFELNPEGVNFP